VVQNTEFFQQYIQNSMPRDGPEMARICEAVKEAGIFVVLGYSERDGGSLYITQSFINPEGKIILTRRKLKPTRKFETPLLSFNRDEGLS
jgi:predicted amidohydrolase